jgi:hypothetical protein
VRQRLRGREGERATTRSRGQRSRVVGRGWAGAAGHELEGRGWCREGMQIKRTEGGGGGSWEAICKSETAGPAATRMCVCSVRMGKGSRGGAPKAHGKAAGEDGGCGGSASEVGRAPRSWLRRRRPCPSDTRPSPSGCGTRHSAGESGPARRRQVRKWVGAGRVRGQVRDGVCLWVSGWVGIRAGAGL